MAEQEYVTYDKYRADLADFRADMAFFSCTSVSESGFTEVSTESAQIKQAMKDAIDFLKKEVPALFESEGYMQEREAIAAKLRKEQHCYHL